jgi:hypothetical protein
MMRCAYCGGPMPLLRNARHKYCGHVCQVRGWREANPEKMREQDRRRYYKDVEKSRRRGREKEARRRVAAERQPGGAG